jgi:hypothetical protein
MAQNECLSLLNLVTFYILVATGHDVITLLALNIIQQVPVYSNHLIVHFGYCS